MYFNCFKIGYSGVAGIRIACAYSKLMVLLILIILVVFYHFLGF